MQKIMFYANKPWTQVYRHMNDDKDNSVKKYSTEILLYSVFICGLMIGSVLYTSKNALQSYFMILSEYLISTQIRQIAINEISVHLFTFFFCVFCAYSCFGTVPIFLFIFEKGVYYSIVVSKLITYNIKGLGYFSLVLLPGSIVSICAAVAMCKISIHFSRSIGAIILHGETNHIDQKKYLSAAGICLCFLLLSVLTECLFTFLFSGLF